MFPKLTAQITKNLLLFFPLLDGSNTLKVTASEKVLCDFIVVQFKSVPIEGWVGDVLRDVNLLRANKANASPTIGLKTKHQT